MPVVRPERRGVVSQQSSNETLPSLPREISGDQSCKHAIRDDLRGMRGEDRTFDRPILNYDHDVFWDFSTASVADGA
jgi:hypothetical protein